MPLPSYFNQINSLGPKIWYRFNETAGTPVNFGSLTTTSTFNNLLLNEQTDVDGRAIYLNGSTSYIQLPSHPSFSLFDDRSFTVECWVKVLNSDTNTTGPYEIFRLNPPSSPHKTISLTMLGTGGGANRGKIRLSSAWTTDLTSTNALDNGQWHHVVYTFNTSSVKLYIDGVLDKSTTPTNLDASFLYDGSTKKLIGAGYVGTAQTTISQYFKGRIDEFAVYSTELQASDILANYNAGASVEFVDSAGTASSLMVNPSLSTECVQAAAPMTANSVSGDHAVSNFDLVNGIQKIISDLSPQQWIKFDIVTDFTTTNPGGTFTNYGSGGQPTFSSAGYNSVILQTGPAQEPNISFGFTGNTGFATTTTSTFFTDEVSDNNFSIGVWFKMPTGIDTSEKQIFAYTGGTNSAIGLRVNNKKVVFTLQTSHTTYTHTETNDISEDAWHFAVTKLDLAANTLKYYLDGTEVFSDTAIQGTRNTPTSFSFGKSGGNGTDTNKTWEISHFFVSTYSAATPTIIDDIWDAGTRQNQAKGVVRQPTLQFINKYDEYVGNLNPITKIGFNETSGSFLENTGSIKTSPFSINGTNYTRGTDVPTKNRYGYNFTNKNTWVSSGYAAGTGLISDNTLTISIYAKIGTVSAGDTQLLALYGAGGGATGIGLIIGANASGPFLAIVPSANPATWMILSSGSTAWFGDYHLYTARRDGSSVKFFIDGEEKASTTYTANNFTDSGSIALGGGETVWLGQAAATVDKFVDEFAAFDYALSDQQISEMYQSIEIDKMVVTTATFPMPTNIAGTGNIQTVSPATGSSEFVMPAISTEIGLSSVSLDAFATFPLPNFGGNVVIDANYGQETATASAVFHDPQFQIGDSHSADYMDASAIMVQPIAIGAGTINAPSLIAQDATLVMPGIVTIKGARIFAEPARANAIFPLPPAYIQLADDDWYVRLYAGHFDGTKEFLQTTLTSIPSGSNTGPVQGGFLTFFDDVSADITTTSSPNTIEGELGQFAYQEPDVFEYDDNGDLVALNTTGTLVRATTSRQSNVPQAILSAGFFDPYERKAVRITNIEFPFPGTGKGFSQRPYNIEFSIKTTKIDQVLAHGFYDQSTSARTIGVVGLSDGKLYLAEDAYKPFTFSFGTGTSGSTTAPHPKNFVNRSQYLIGRTNIADGNWHHVVIQQGFGTETLRTQIWVDGKLDRQIITIGPFPGIDGTNTIRPYILGFNSSDTLLASDFQTSAWNFYPGRFVDSRTISLNYTAYQKSKPIKVEPFTASATTPQNHKATGNRGRALLLFFWPKTGVLGNRPGSVGQGTIDYGLYGEQDEETFDNTVYTLDLPGIDPEDYYGWDLFPLDVTGTWGTGYTRQSAQSDMLKPGVWTSSDGYRDTNTGARRYLDLMNDIDITQFDAIFFKNFPEQTPELDTNTRDELADVYFGLDESDLYSDFIKSLRAAVDSGVSLYITNATLAKDLGIIDSYEIVSDMSEGGFNPDSTFVNNKFTTTAINEYEYGEWKDTNKNNKFRIVNTLENLTDEPGYIWSDWMYYRPNAELEIGDPNRPYVALVNKPNGLQIGDEFIMSDSSIKTYRYEAVPFDKVKAGKIIAAFSNNINQNGVLSENPFRNYATVIAVEPGTVVNGRPIGGKVLVNFTERLGSHRRDGSRDTLSVDLIQDEWINLAYNTGLIDLAKRNELLTATYNLDRRLEAAIAANNTTLINLINELKYWDSNGDYILVQKNLFDDSTAGGIPKDGIREQRRSRVNKLNKKGTLTTQTTTSSSFFFSFEYSFQYLRLQVTVPSMLTRGFRWLSDKIVLDGTVVRAEPMNNITATAVQPAVSAAKPASINAQAMLANGFITSAVGYSPADVVITTLPAQASVGFGQYVKNIRPDVFAANANMRQNVRTVGIQEDEVVVYMIHVDPILYLREDVIK